MNSYPIHCFKIKVAQHLVKEFPYCDQFKSKNEKVTGSVS